VSGVKAALQKRISERNSIPRVRTTLLTRGANNSSVSHCSSPPQGRRNRTRAVTLPSRTPRSRSSSTKSSAFTGPRHHHSHFSCSRRHARLPKALQRHAYIPPGSTGARRLYPSCHGQVQRESFLSSQRSPHSYEGVIRYLLDFKLRLSDHHARLTVVPEMPHNRHSLDEKLYLSEATCTSLKADPSLRIMLYCATTSTLGPYAFNIDIAFPSQIEVKINGEEVRKSFKGLKNKPGTTKPVDITDLVRKTSSAQNIIHVTYALTKEVCRTVSIKSCQSPC